MENQIASEDFAPDFVKDFDKLYAKNLKERFEPALVNLTMVLTALLDETFPTSQRMRLHLDPGRIKSPNRLLLKAWTPKYRAEIETARDIFRVIPDIVGTRVTCNTLSDVYSVVEAIRACVATTKSARTLRKVIDDWIDDYIRNPKPSGYRGINLIVGVLVPRGALMEPITCEIQIRTLLQHGWGELTHEDTYKPGVKVPELVGVLGKRLATALAVLDEIAQDLRNELDKLESPEPDIEPPAETQAPVANKGISEEPPSSGPAAKAQKSVAAPIADLNEGVKRDEAQMPSKEDLADAFRTTFDQDPTIAESAVGGILRELQAASLYRVEEIAAALEDCREAIEGLESQYDGISLNDLGRVRAAIKFRQGAERGAAWVKEVLNNAEELAATRERFKTSYPEGKETLGTVVYDTWNYALVQLPEGDTGILHVTGMKSHSDEYINVRDLVRAGDTVRVRVIKASPDSKRIELQLIR